MFIDFYKERKGKKKKGKTSISCLSYTPWPNQGLNLQPLDVQGDALTNSHPARAALPIFKSDFVSLIELYEFFYILDMNPLSPVWLANIFSHSLGCLVILLMISFAVQKHFSLI